MSLPAFSTQAELFSTAGLAANLFAQSDRYRLFAKMVYPHLVAARATLAKCYCQENGRVAIEPVVMLGISILQDVDGVPDRQAIEMLRYHAGWNFALNRQLGDPVFHPTTLVNFRGRLEEHEQSALGFTTILQALEEAGLVSRQSRQRLDSTQMFGRVARMSRLDCVRESLRLALQELDGATQAESRPLCWAGLWERYVESQADYRAGAETLARKLAEARCRGRGRRPSDRSARSPRECARRLRPLPWRGALRPGPAAWQSAHSVRQGSDRSSSLPCRGSFAGGRGCEHIPQNGCDGGDRQRWGTAGGTGASRNRPLAGIRLGQASWRPAVVQPWASHSPRPHRQAPANDLKRSNQRCYGLCR